MVMLFNHLFNTRSFFDFSTEGRTNILHGTFGTVRLAGEATSASMKYQAVREIAPIFFGKERFQVELDLSRVVVICEAQAMGKSFEVRIDDDARLSIRGGHQQVRCFPADAGKRDERLEVVWRIAFIIFYQFGAQGANVLCFIVEKPRGSDFIFQDILRNFRPIFRCPKFFKQRGGDEIDPLVGALRG